MVRGLVQSFADSLGVDVGSATGTDVLPGEAFKRGVDKEVSVVEGGEAGERSSTVVV